MMAIYLRINREKIDNRRRKRIIEECKLYTRGEDFRVYEDIVDEILNYELTGLVDMLEDVKNSGLTHVIVYRLGQLCRTPKELMKLCELFYKHQVGLISVQDNFNSETSMGKAVIQTASYYTKM